MNNPTLEELKEVLYTATLQEVQMLRNMHRRGARLSDQGPVRRSEALGQALAELFLVMDRNDAINLLTKAYTNPEAS
jgi:hypothetical protein